MPCSAVRRLDADVVREAARGQWRNTIYPALGIEVGQGKHMACPHCGGKDRFRCDGGEGSGSYYCNQCGAGDGFSLVMKVLRCEFPESLRLVAGVLRLDPSMPRSLRPTPKPPRVDRVALAFQLDLHALDLRLRAARITDAGKKLNISELTDVDLDQALGHVVQAYADVQRADLFEHTADTLRESDFNERTNREHQRCVA